MLLPFVSLIFILFIILVLTHVAHLRLAQWHHCCCNAASCECCCCYQSGTQIRIAYYLNDVLQEEEIYGDLNENFFSTPLPYCIEDSNPGDYFSFDAYPLNNSPYVEGARLVCLNGKAGQIQWQFMNNNFELIPIDGRHDENCFGGIFTNNYGERIEVSLHSGAVL